jgi:hypothetical protein
MIREKVGKCSSAKELWDKLHNIYSSPITESKNVKEDVGTDSRGKMFIMSDKFKRRRVCNQQKYVVFI